MSSATGPTERGSRADWAKAVLLLALLVAYQLVLHWTVSSRPDSGLGEALIIGPLAVMLVWLLGRTPRGRVLLGVTALLAIAAWAVWRAAGADPAIVYLLPHVGAYLFMLWLFGRTLVAGRQSLVTGLALRVHGSLPDEIMTYTRRVTWAWCLFFAAMVLISLGLFLFAPLSVWSVFANLLNLPLVAAMFLAEYVYRIRRHRDFSHASLRTTIRAFQKFGGSGESPGR
jgi:uncharacterized membrane protein